MLTFSIKKICSLHQWHSTRSVNECLRRRTWKRTQSKKYELVRDQFVSHQGCLAVYFAPDGTLPFAVSNRPTRVSWHHNRVLFYGGWVSHARKIYTVSSVQLSVNLNVAEKASQLYTVCLLISSGLALLGLLIFQLVGSPIEAINDSHLLLMTVVLCYEAPLAIGLAWLRLHNQASLFFLKSASQPLQCNSRC
ncbi:hypothetical protein QW180_19045 [Vibrio sinaloensis]|nr:hypothetical protein [Vibrio sinaloensis]